MTRPGRFAVSLLAAALAAAVLAPADARQAKPQRIVAIGDIHGAYDELEALLRRTGLIDARRRWTGGSTILVQTGDFTDRGAGVREAMDLLMALEPQAEKAGGRVVVLMANHEAMNIVAETRDATPEIFATFADSRSDRRRQNAWREYSDIVRRFPGPLPEVDERNWRAQRPRGFVEYRLAFGPSGRYGRWIRKLPVAVRIADTVFMHAGISPELDISRLEDVNARIDREIADFDRAWRTLEDMGLIRPFFTLGEALVMAHVVAAQLKELNRPHLVELDGLLRLNQSWLLDPEGPLWYRGYATWSDEEGTPLVGPLLERLGAGRIVVGHTPTPAGRIWARFDNRILLIDTGMLPLYQGRASALEIAGDRLTAIYLDEAVTLRPASR